VCLLLRQTLQYAAEGCERTLAKATAAKLSLTVEELKGLLDQLPLDGPAPEKAVKVRISMPSEFKSP
jgi:hypothetical protein